MSELIKIILVSVGELAELGVKLVTGSVTEDEARAECIRLGTRIKEGDTDAVITEIQDLIKTPPEGIKTDG
jgi:hypothetical protein